MGTKSQKMGEEGRLALSSLFSCSIANYLDSHCLLLLTMTSKEVWEAVLSPIRERAENEGEGAVFMGRTCGSEHLIKAGKLLFESAFQKNKKVDYRIFTIDGQVFSEGYNIFGRTGQGMPKSPSQIIDQNLKVQIDALKHLKVRKVAHGRGHALAITSDGELYTWGKDRNGQLGHGHNVSNCVYEPRKVKFFQGEHVVIDADVGDGHTVVLTEENSVFAFGKCYDGQCGPHHPGCVSMGVTEVHLQDVNRVTIGVKCAGDSTMLITDKKRSRQGVERSDEKRRRK